MQRHPNSLLLSQVTVSQHARQGGGISCPSILVSDDLGKANQGRELQPPQATAGLFFFPMLQTHSGLRTKFPQVSI